MDETEFHQWMYDKTMSIYPDVVDSETGEPVDDWGFNQTERDGFVAGAIAAYEELTRRV